MPSQEGLLASDPRAIFVVVAPPGSRASGHRVAPASCVAGLEAVELQDGAPDEQDPIRRIDALRIWIVRVQVSDRLEAPGLGSVVYE